MKKIVVVGGDLFHLALIHLGDASQWNRIAAASGLLDPALQGQVTLTIPDQDAGAGGGILGGG